MSEGNLKNTWSDEELRDWSFMHTDAWHPGTRDECEHCQEMIRDFGPMPPVYMIEAYYAALPKKDGRTKHSISESTRWEVWERDNFTCQFCGSRRYLSVDHIIAESKGGANDISNYQTLCRKCNMKKGNR